MSSRSRCETWECPNPVSSSNPYRRQCDKCRANECLMCSKQRTGAFLYCSRTCAGLMKSRMAGRGNERQGGLFQTRMEDASAGVGPIYFYERDQPFYEFTNFAEFPIVVDGKLYPTSEHYFQSQKFIDTPFEDDVRQAPSARAAFTLAREAELRAWERADWTTVKEQVMLRALREKFTQHKYIYHLLLATNSRALVEHTDNDDYWGDNLDGSGQNRLGLLLIQIRDELRRGNLQPNFAAYDPRSY